MNTKHLFLVLFAFFFHIGAYAAAPLTHLYLSDLFLSVEKHLIDDENLLFLKGSVFPDIRYIANLPRENTHSKNTSYGDVILSNNWFQKGISFHVYVDRRREEIAEEKNIYSLVKKYSPKHQATFLKLAEDELIFRECAHKCFKEMFSQKLCKEELQVEIPIPIILKWNNYLSSYLSQKPSTLLKKMGENQQSLFGIDSSTLALWSKLLPEFVEEEEFQNYYFSMLANIFQDIKSRINQ